MKKVFLLGLFWVWFHATGQSHRAAFLIGVGNYDPMPPLTNPPNDADSMRAALMRLGYDTYEVKDASNKIIRDSMNRWFGLMRNYHDVFIYFSGHGFMVLSDNEFLAPNDFDPKSYTNVEQQTIHKYYLLDSLKKIESLSGSKLVNKVIFIDACRNFPELKKIKEALGTLNTKAPAVRRWYVEYSTPAGGVVSGNGEFNSPATAAWLTQLRDRPGDDVHLLWNDLQATLDSISNNTELLEYGGNLGPWEFSVASTGPVAFIGFTPNSYFCGNCLPEGLPSLSSALGAKMETVLYLSGKSNVRRLKVGRESGSRTFVAGFDSSWIGMRMKKLLAEKGIENNAYQSDSSFVVYEINGDSLTTIQLYLKYRSLDFHRSLARMLGVSLSKYPGMSYLAPKGQEADIMMVQAKYLKGNAVLFARLVQFPYSIVEVGPSLELYDDTHRLDKFKNVFKALDVRQMRSVPTLLRAVFDSDQK